MTKEELKQKAKAEANKVIIGSGMDRASVIHLKHLLVTMYMQGATEATKELEKENARLTTNEKSLLAERKIIVKENTELKAQIEKLKCCGNCIYEINEDDVIVQTDYCDNCFEFCNWKLRR